MWGSDSSYKIASNPAGLQKNSKMSDAAAPAPAPKKVVKATKPKKAGTDYAGLIKAAILELKERGGSSVAAIKKVLASKLSKTAPGWEKRLSMSLKSMTKSGKLVRACMMMRVLDFFYLYDVGESRGE